MKPQFQHEATTSFALWLDHHLCKNAEAFENKAGNLYYQEDDRIPRYPEDPYGFISYASEYKQWVYDSDVEGAEIPDGVYIDSGDGYSFCPRGESGLMIDFDNGRAILSGKYFEDNYSALNIKANFAVKDINIYLSDDTEENLVLENKYNVNSRTVPHLGKGEGVNPYEHMAPAAFISMERTVNTPFALGGEDLTHLYYRAVFFTENLYQLDGSLSVCADTVNLGLANIGYDDYPLNEYGDLKSGSFSYCETASNCRKVPGLMFIDNVYSSKISDRLSKTTNPNLFLGFVDFEVCQPRFPRS
tara:strand:+ start:4100 stop:5005 length:906 start_codon:yes stop_codon:yes gene_type:complete